MSIMRLLPGDLADRQSIVELKINHCNAEFDQDQAEPKGKMLGMTRTLVNKNAVNVAPFIDELDLIRKALTDKWFTLDKQNTPGFVEKYDELYHQLSETNSELWKLEDTIRALKNAPDDTTWMKREDWSTQVVSTAFAIVDNNDKRSEIIKSINKLWNYNTQEKMY